jgi:hypothetical protein
MAIYFHDRRKGIVHTLGGATSDWPLKGSMTDPISRMREAANESTAQNVQRVLRHNQDMLLDGRSNIPKPTGTIAGIINNTADGMVVSQDFPSGGRSVRGNESIHYGLTDSVLKRKADKLERGAQAKGK